MLWPDHYGLRCWYVRSLIKTHLSSNGGEFGLVGRRVKLTDISGDIIEWSVLLLPKKTLKLFVLMISSTRSSREPCQSKSHHIFLVSEGRLLIDSRMTNSFSLHGIDWKIPLWWREAGGWAKIISPVNRVRMATRPTPFPGIFWATYGWLADLCREGSSTKAASVDSSAAISGVVMIVIPRPLLNLESVKVQYWLPYVLEQDGTFVHGSIGTWMDTCELLREAEFPCLATAPPSR